MLPAALRVAAIGVSTLIATAGLRAADTAARTAPTRPGAVGTASREPVPAPAPKLANVSPPAPAGPRLATKRFGGIEYVRLAEAAPRLGAKLTWLERGRRAALIAPAGKTELEADSRDVVIAGRRVFLGNPVLETGGELYVSRIDFERCLAPMLRPGYGAIPPARVRTIVLDPGHGGRDHGTSLNEKTYALDVARRAKTRLEAAGFRVVLTRDTDVFLDLGRRAAIANAQRADLFVSIHFNALERDTRTQGVEVYTFAPQFQTSTDSWSPGKKSDAEDEPSKVNAFDHWSVVLARGLHRELLDRLQAPDRGKKLMHLGVLRALQCPGVLVECGFLTSEAEARKIATPAYRQQIADALAAGIRGYADTVASLRPKG